MHLSKQLSADDFTRLCDAGIEAAKKRIAADGAKLVIKQLEKELATEIHRELDGDTNLDVMTRTARRVVDVALVRLRRALSDVGYMAWELHQQTNSHIDGRQVSSVDLKSATPLSSHHATPPTASAATRWLAIAVIGDQGFVELGLAPTTWPAVIEAESLEEARHKANAMALAQARARPDWISEAENLSFAQAQRVLRRNGLHVSVHLTPLGDTPTIRFVDAGPAPTAPHPDASQATSAGVATAHAPAPVTKPANSPSQPVFRSAEITPRQQPVFVAPTPHPSPTGVPGERNGHA